MIGIAAVQVAITTTGICIAWWMAHKQIQVMLAQTKPTEKPPKTRILWLSVFGFGLPCFAALWSLFWFIYYFILLPAAPRSYAIGIVLHVALFYINARGAFDFWKKPFRELIP
jgi:CBS domain containing-hemolysin-like protein